MHALPSSGKFMDSNQTVTFITLQLSNDENQHQNTTTQTNHNTPHKSCASCKGTRNILFYLVVKQFPKKIFWGASLLCHPRDQPKLSTSTMTQLACPGKGGGTISWPECASTHSHCTLLPQRQQGILYRAAIQLVQGFLQRDLRRNGNKNAKDHSKLQVL